MREAEIDRIHQTEIVVAALSQQCNSVASVCEQAARNLELLKYFSQRRAWLVEPDENPVRVSQYSTSLNVSESQSASSKALADKGPLAPTEGFPNGQKVGARDR